MLICLSTLLSCDSRPGGVPSKGRMEKLLYDYHKAQASLETMNMESSVEGEKYMLGVFAKHGMDSQMFDSAMVWYNAHPDELRTIYLNIEKRLKAEDEELQAQVGTSRMTAVYSEGGDTTNLWNGSSLIALRADRLHNLDRFTLKADTSYHDGDHFVLNADVKMIREDHNSYGTITINLSIRTKDGNVYSQTSQSGNNEMMSVSINHSSDSPISEISGFFYYKSDASTKSLCIINGISLIRMHVHEAATDTLSSDSLGVDSLIDEKPSMGDDIPDIPSYELSDSAPSTTVPSNKPSRQNEVEQIRIERAPTTTGQQGSRQRRMSVQESRREGNPQGAQPRRIQQRRQPTTPTRSR